jgi:hypothetical protein
LKLFKIRNTINETGSENNNKWVMALMYVLVKEKMFDEIEVGCFENKCSFIKIRHEAKSHQQTLPPPPTAA